MTNPAYRELTHRQTRLHHLQHLQAIAGWDQASNMPSKGNEARSNAMAELDGLMHQMRTEASLSDLIAQAQAAPLSEQESANLREIKREWQSNCALPQALVEARVLATSRCEHAWRTQRQANDWAGYLPNLREVVRITREEAAYLAKASGLSRYDALLDRYEPGMTGAELDRVFGAMRQWLPGLIQQVRAKQSSEPVQQALGPFCKVAQKALSVDVMQMLGFDFEAGRLDESTHPFCGGVPEDVRITTRYREDSFSQSMTGTMHETGHARYEQNLPREHLGQPVAKARSMGIHESQSLSFEMQLGCDAKVVALLAPLVRKHLGDQAAFETSNLVKLLTRVAPGYIRVDADEVTYPAHVIMRYEIERALVEGEIEVEDIPALWDAKMLELLSIDTRGNYKDGCMQDVHWGAGLIGYFPSYTLGAMYAAQWFAAMRSQMPELDSELAKGNLQPVFDWLKREIWQQGSRFTTQELTVKASGEPLNPEHFKAHLERSYLAAS